ncbi:YgaP family membrane protein [Arcticibacterium luteifluviistationis]|uniref:DUF2892 domain-containing protein n=1 Tax=Arcticibacterium luteifluviistationis TaxID=1784714 RepID=A0A2Z4G6K7_9BACT|nr:DUF2892 domain-containing protein [Arcticibacterium luteifluviistationis]AWV96781.1 DUF2892 domain-containing protein [Arcticibacterium luteifluviistationis]
MKFNMGTLDRRIRFGIAIIIMVLYYNNIISGVLSIVLLVIMGVLLITSFIGYCPIYSAFGVSTTKKSKSETN